MRHVLNELLAYHKWANERFFDLVSMLSPSDYAKDLGSSHGGVRGTAVHMYNAEYIWLSRLNGQSPRRMFSESYFPDWKTLQAEWLHLEKRLDRIKTNLNGSADDVIEYTTTAGKKFAQPKWQMLSHFVNHASYHRGQIVTMVRQLESEVDAHPHIVIQPLDLISYYRNGQNSKS